MGTFLKSYDTFARPALTGSGSRATFRDAMVETHSSLSKRIAVIPGDGVGKEVVPEAVKVLKAAAAVGGREILITEFDWGADRYLRDGTTLPGDAVEMFRRDYHAILLGALGDPRVPTNQQGADILIGLRFKLDLYVNARPCVLFDERLTPLKGRTEKDINFWVIRENTEGLYAGVGGFFKKGTADEIATQEDVNTRKGVERIIRYAFDLARRQNRRRVCMSDKSNALAYGHDLWQRVFKEIRNEYPEIEASHMYIDNLLMQMVRSPDQFEVIVTCNLFGDLASDVGAGLIGGLGLAPSGNIHPGRVSLFEPVHGSAPDIAGKNVANPSGAVLAAAMMCDYMGWTGEARAMEAAVRQAIVENQTTVDLGGSLGTREAGDWLADRVASA
jgi:3-isopropylmalate dehydrogenase